MTARSFRPGILDNDPALLERPPVAWLWPGILGSGKVTLLTSLWKSGKTTLLALLLERRRRGGTLAGLPVLPGRTAVISEEPDDIWAERLRRLDFGGKVHLFCEPFDRQPNFIQWLELLEHMLELHHDFGVDLVVIDTIASFLPGNNENNAVVVQAALLPLRKLTRAGMTVWLLHHPKKGDPAQGQAARGSGAFGGFPDICLEMRHPGGDPATRRRLIHGLSRFKETPRNFTIELNADETDYDMCATTDADFRGSWDVILMVLEEAHHPLTRRQLLEEWPEDFPKPADQTLWKWLARAVELGLAKTAGTGHRNEPFRYWLPMMEEQWKSDPHYLFYQNDREAERMRAQLGMPGRAVRKSG